MNKLTGILSTTNITILIVMAGGNLILGIKAYFQEFGRMDCIREAIYHNATENGFVQCVLDSGLFHVRRNYMDIRTVRFNSDIDNDCFFH